MASNFDPCIKALTGIASKAFGKEEAKALLQKLQETANNLAGVSADQKLAGLREAAGEFAEKNLMQAKVNKMRTALNNVAHAQIIKDVTTNYKDPVDGLLTLWKGGEHVRFGAHDSIPARINGARMLAVSRLVQDVQQLKAIDGSKSIGDMAAKGTLDRALAWHLAAKTDPTIKIPDNLDPVERDAGAKLADVCKNHQNEGMNLLNLQGCNIVDLKGRITKQTHNPTEMLAMGKANFTKLAMDHFHPDTYDGKAPADFLSSMYDAVTSGIRLSREGKTGNAFKNFAGNMAQQLSSQRLVKFKDPDAALAYRSAMKQPGSLFNDVMGEIDKDHGNAALMSRLGPDPHGTWDRVKTHFIENYRTDNNTKNRLSAALSDNGRITNIFKNVTGYTAVDHNPNVSRIFDGLRAFTTVGKQVLSTFKALPDVAAGASFLSHWGASTFDSASAFAKGWSDHFGITHGNAWEQGNKQSWYMAEHYFTNNANSWRDSQDMKGLSRKVVSALYKWNGQLAWDAQNKYTIALTVSRLLGGHAASPLASIADKDVQRSLFKYGVDSDSWDTIRQSVTHTEPGGNRSYITGDGVQNLPDSAITELLNKRGVEPTAYAIQRARNDLATKVSTIMTDAGDHIITLAGPNERAIMNQGLQKGLVWRGLLDLATQFKGYALASAYRTGASLVYGRGAESTAEALQNKNGELWAISKLIATGMAAWYIGDTAKNAILGVSPRLPNDNAPNNIQNGLTALAGSGGLGPYADLLTADPSSDKLSALGDLISPTIGTVSQGVGLAWKSTIGQMGGAIEGKRPLFPATQDIRYIQDSTPGLSFPPVKMALNYLILYHLENMLNPKSNKEREARLKQQTGQQYFFPPSAQ